MHAAARPKPKIEMIRTLFELLLPNSYLRQAVVLDYDLEQEIVFCRREQRSRPLRRS
jgi:hypothetical protein